MKSKMTYWLTMVSLLLFISTFIEKAAVGEVAILSFKESFDLYVNPGSTLSMHDCEIAGVACKYHEAVPVGKKPVHPKARFIGVGTINLDKFVTEEKERAQLKITLFRFIDVELNRSLSRGINAIQNILLSQEDICSGNYYLRNSYFEEMIATLTKQIQKEFKKNGKTESVTRGQILLKKLRCLD